MTEYAEIAGHVARDVKDGKLTGLREDGLYRHVEFTALKGWSRIILVTWPYNLLVAGSHGSYHFERQGPDTEDMFDWLRDSRVNPDSWASKLANGRDLVCEYDRSRMEAQINERVAEAVRDDWAPEGLEGEVREEILDSHLLDTKDTAFQLVSEFEYKVMYRAECSCGVASGEGSYGSASLWKYYDHKADGKKHAVHLRRLSGFDFADFAEWDVDKLSYHFVYQCHALVWAIGQYDAARKTAEVAA
ncbi:hypothetical protein ACIRU8_39000 [Streptomyces sp. NPDC101175]|uniref:hypothetical protein n=1 Tax=Streptomyces sp. NPDC101175 TaxID=3366123 RepID=UPI0038349D3E